MPNQCPRPGNSFLLNMRLNVLLGFYSHKAVKKSKGLGISFKTLNTASISVFLCPFSTKQVSLSTKLAQELKAKPFVFRLSLHVTPNSKLLLYLLLNFSVFWRKIVLILLSLKSWARALGEQESRQPWT